MYRVVRPRTPADLSTALSGEPKRGRCAEVVHNLSAETSSRYIKQPRTKACVCYRCAIECAKEPSADLLAKKDITLSSHR